MSPLVTVCRHKTVGQDLGLSFVVDLNRAISLILIIMIIFVQVSDPFECFHYTERTEEERQQLVLSNYALYGRRDRKGAMCAVNAPSANNPPRYSFQFLEKHQCEKVNEAYCHREVADGLHLPYNLSFLRYCCDTSHCNDPFYNAQLFDHINWPKCTQNDQVADSKSRTVNKGEHLKSIKLRRPSLICYQGSKEFASVSRPDVNDDLYRIIGYEKSSTTASFCYAMFFRYCDENVCGARLIFGHAFQNQLTNDSNVFPSCKRQNQVYCDRVTITAQNGKGGDFRHETRAIRTNLCCETDRCNDYFNSSLLLPDPLHFCVGSEKMRKMTVHRFASIGTSGVSCNLLHSVFAHNLLFLLFSAYTYMAIRLIIH